jgi:hypothetical protein
VLKTADLVENCQPCSFKPGSDTPVYSFTFDWRSGADERTIAGIEVSAGGKTVARLPVKEMMPVGKDETVFFGPEDINFDGYQDVLLVTEKGTANANAEYWLYDLQTKSFRYLSKYPLFKVDRAHKRLTTYERGGNAGLLYEAKAYEWRNGQLTLVREEKQDAGEKPRTYRRTVRELVNGQMRVTNSRTLSAKAAAAEH